MRRRPPSEAQIYEMARLYESGLSLAAVGKRVESSAGTVKRRLAVRGVLTRDTHGKNRSVCQLTVWPPGLRPNLKNWALFSPGMAADRQKSSCRSE